MSLYDQIAEVTEEENKLAGKDVAGGEKVKANVDIPKDEDDEPTKDTERAKGNGADTDVKGDDKAKERAADGKFKPKDAPKDEAKKAAGEGDDPAAADTKEPVDHTAVAKLRYEAAQQKRRADAAEAALKQAPTQPQPGPAKARTETEKRILAEPDPNLDPEAHLRWELQQTKAQLQEVAAWKQKKDYEEQRVTLRDEAVKSYTSYENEFKDTVADYGEVTRFGIQAIASSIMTLNPALKGEALNDAVKHKVLELGAQAEARGEQPAEFFYKQSKAWGYKPEPPKAEDTPAPEKKTPSVKNIAEHKKRSATSLTPGGKSGSAPVSREQVMSKNMTLADFAKLTPNQLRELEAQEG